MPAPPRSCRRRLPRGEERARNHDQRPPKIADRCSSKIGGLHARESRSDCFARSPNPHTESNVQRAWLANTSAIICLLHELPRDRAERPHRRRRWTRRLHYNEAIRCHSTRRGSETAKHIVKVLHPPECAGASAATKLRHSRPARPFQTNRSRSVKAHDAIAHTHAANGGRSRRRLSAWSAVEPESDCLEELRRAVSGEVLQEDAAAGKPQTSIVDDSAMNRAPSCICGLPHLSRGRMQQRW